MLIPEEHAKTCTFCGSSREIQQKYLKEILAEFQNLTIWQSHKLKEEPIGIEGLRKLAKEVYGNGKANEILNPKI